MSEEIWKDVTSEYNREEDGWRFVRTVSDNCFISVLKRMTGFGFHEIETAFKFKELNGEYDKFILILGDHREATTNLTEDEVVEYAIKHSDEKITANIIFDKLQNK